MKFSNVGVALALLAGLTMGCAASKPGDVDLTPTLRLKVDAHLGKSMNTDGNKIQDVSNEFGPNETVYATVDVPGRADGTMKVKWVYGETETIQEQDVTLGDETTLYKFNMPPANGGHRAGDYRFEVYIDNNRSDSESFKVTAG